MLILGSIIEILMSLFVSILVIIGAIIWKAIWKILDKNPESFGCKLLVNLTRIIGLFMIILTFFHFILLVLTPKIPGNIFSEQNFTKQNGIIYEKSEELKN